MSDAIKAALEAAAQAASDADQVLTSERDWRLRIAGASVGAFLRTPGVWAAVMQDYEAVTEAVERAAREGRDGS